MKNFLIPLILIGTLSTAQVDEYISKAKTSLDNAEKQVFKTNIVIPDVVKKCPCDGKGYIVQGDGHKSDCPGVNGEPCKYKKKTGDAPKMTAPALKHGIVIMYSRPGCLGCDNWLKNIAPKILKSGWRVKMVEADDYSSVPYFGVIMNGEEHRMSGILTVEGLNRFNSQFQRNKK